MTTLNDLLKFSPEAMAEAAAADLYALRGDATPHGGFSMPDVVWLLVRTVTTGRQVGGLILDAEELADARQKMTRFLDIAIAGGWRGLDLVETLIARGEASERLESLARKAGRHCDHRPDLIEREMRAHFGDDVGRHIFTAPSTQSEPAVLPPMAPPVALRKPLDHHFHRTTDEHGEELYHLSAEATLLTAAQTGYDPSEIADAQDGGVRARHVVACILTAAQEANYSRVGALRQMLTSVPVGRETLAAIEHLTGECGAGVIERGMTAAGLRIVRGGGA